MAVALRSSVQLMPLGTRTIVTWLLVAAGFVAAGALSERWAGPRGLALTVQPASGAPPLPARTVATVDLRDIRADRRIPSGARHAWWEGFWRVREAGTYRLVAQGEGAVSVRVDGHTVLSGRSHGRLGGQVDLDPGFLPLVVEYEPTSGPDQLRLRWAPAGQPARDFDPGSLFTAVPSSREQARGTAAKALRALAAAAAVLPALAVALVAGWRRLRTGRWPDELAAWCRSAAGRRSRAALAIALPAAVVSYAAALRFEALVGRYSWEGPPWALQAARVIEGWHPATLFWRPVEEISGGDPYHYVGRARAMRGFYDADVREPLFPSITRLLLRPLGDRILAVHVASALCSTLLVLAAYLLGASAFSRAVGLGAALTLAVERDALWWSVEGFRDDAFALFVTLCALALVRLQKRPTVLHAVLAGVAGGACCLTRITALSFLLPALVWLLLGRDDQAAARRKAVALSLLVLLLVVGPYLWSCALAYGDPLYAVNFHTKFYRSRSGMDHQQAMGWLDYLRTGSPLLAQLETGIRGLTTYPFTNKWHGLHYLASWLQHLLAAASLGGLVLFVRSRTGRLLVVVLVTSLLPYAFTWRVPGGAEWRFTMHAYPFYLIAAWLALAQAASLAWRLVSGESPPNRGGGGVEGRSGSGEVGREGGGVDVRAADDQADAAPGRSRVASAGRSSRSLPASTTPSPSSGVRTLQRQPGTRPRVARNSASACAATSWPCGFQWLSVW